MEWPATVQLLNEKTLHQQVDTRQIAYNPSMDLLALSSTDQQVLIYRLNGQRVHASSPKAKGLGVGGFCWKPNGQFFAIAWSNGSVRILGPETNKTIYQFSTGDKTSGITCMGWACNRTSSSLGPPGSRNTLETLDELLFDGNLLAKRRTTLNLPKDLAQIDIERSLPKLSVLPAGSNGDDVFSSGRSLFVLFRPFDPNDLESADVMVIGSREGDIHLSIYDSFVIGSFKSPHTIGAPHTYLFRHASHESYSTHALLMKSATSENKLYFMTMDLRFMSASSDYLSILSSRSTHLHNLLRYIHHAQTVLVSEWKVTQELPAKFLRNINETLNETSNRNIVQALYHSVATGHTFPGVRDWLVDELAERGHKRWDRAVVTGLENMKRLLHENLLPALERCSVILSRFAGIAKFQESDDIVGFSSHQISLIMDTLACLNLVYSKILVHAVDELDLFSSFSAWLRYEIDRLVSDPSQSSTGEEGPEQEGSIDHSKVLLYLQTSMTTSPLAVYFTTISSDAGAGEDWARGDHGLSLFNSLDSQLQKQEQGLPYESHLLQVDFLFNILSRQTTTIFGQIAEAEKRNVLFGKAEELHGIESSAVLDMKMGPIDQSTVHTNLAVRPKDRSNQVQIIRITLALENGISTVHGLDSSVLQFGDGQIKDVKFADGYTMLVLWESKESTSILAIPYGVRVGQNALAYTISYTPYNPNSPSRPTVFGNDELIEQFSRCTIENEGSFVAEKLEVQWQGGRTLNDRSKRIVVFGSDQMQYKVFGLNVSSTTVKKSADEDTSMS